VDVQESLEQALRSSEPVSELRALAVRLFAEGQTNEAVLAFEAARQRLWEEQREADEEAVMEGMDFLVGWCAPHMKLPDPAPLAPEVKP
jgi:hypothetical protein